MKIIRFLKKNIAIIIFIIAIIFLLSYKSKEGFHNTTDSNEIVFKTYLPGGLCCHLNILITHLVDYPNTTKVTYDVRSPNRKSPISFIKENEELFSLLFDTYDEGTEIEQTMNVANINRFDITGVKAFNFYNNNRDGLLPYSQAYKKYIHIKPHIQEMIDAKASEMRETYTNIVGIFIRSNALKDEQPNGKMPSREDYVNAINNIQIPNTKYFLCIDNTEDLEYFKELCAPNYYTDIRRTDERNNGEPHTNTYGSLKDLQDSFIEVALLSQCDCLIHCVSNMATASLYMNMNQISICVSK